MQCILLLLGLSGFAYSQMMVGGPTVENANDQQFMDMAWDVVAKINNVKGIKGRTYIFVPHRIVNATTQMVAGTLTKLFVRVGPSNCKSKKVKMAKVTKKKCKAKKNGVKQNYDYFERPVENSSLPLDVRVRFLLNQIMDVDEKNQVMAILAYIDFHWTDYKLSWDPDQFGGIRDIRFSGDDDAPFKLWRPDVLLFNSVSEAFDSTYSSRFIVKYDGEVQQNPPGIFKFICGVDVTYYPFDTQTCYLKLGSWTYNGNYINLDFILQDIVGVHGHVITANKTQSGENEQSYFVNESIDLQVFLTNGEWDLMNTPGKRVVTYFDSESYHELYYYIHIRRRTLAYGINLIIPSFLILIMSVLGFTLPPEAGEKVSLETTILLSVIFFLQMVSNMSPPQSKSVPILAAFFSCCLMVVSCSCVVTVFVLGLSQRKPETHQMSPLIRKVFVEWLPYILLMKTPDHPRAPKAKVIDRLPIHRLSMLPMLKMPRSSHVFTSGNKRNIVIANQLRYYDQFNEGLLEIRRDLNQITERIEENYKTEIALSEWRFVAMAVDRACLFMFTTFVVVSTSGIILPHIIEATANLT